MRDIKNKLRGIKKMPLFKIFSDMSSCGKLLRVYNIEQNMSAQNALERRRT